MKKFFLLLALSALFLIASCGGSSNNKNKDQSDSGEPQGDTDVVDTEPSGDTEPAGDTEPSGDTEPTEPSDDADSQPDSSDSQPDNDNDADTAPYIDPCKEQPCQLLKNSDSTCIRIDNENYTCGCDQGYIWDADTKSCLSEKECSLDNQGPCIDSKTGLMWSKKSKNAQAADSSYCSNLNEEGEIHWNVPVISQLRTLVKECDDTATGGSCDVNDDCGSDTCGKQGCSCDKQTDGRYSRFGDTESLIAGGWAIDFSSASITPANAEGYFRCVKCAEEGYLWNGSMCVKKLSLGNICTRPTTCSGDYDHNACPALGEDFYGQDLQYKELGFCTKQKYVFEENVSGETTVIDMNTGLEWPKKIYKTEYTWADAEKYCDTLNYGGHSDWHLPAPLEYLTIVDLQDSNSVLKEAFSGELGSKYWTSKNSAKDSGKAWYIEITEENVQSESKTEKHSVMCVRSELAQAEFVKNTKNSETIVTDTVSGLMWHQAPDKFGETGESEKNGLLYCEDLTYFGYTDWRLPNKHELASLLNYDRFKPASDFPDNELGLSHDDYTYLDDELGIYNDHYSPTSSIGNHTTVFTGISLSTGDIASYRIISGLIMCVRSDKCADGYFWDGSQCVETPCYSNACNVANSTKFCIPKTEMEYECSCAEGYFWNSKKWKCVSPCEESPCAADVNSTNECTAISDSVYSCGCNAGYTWISENGSGSCNEDSAMTLAEICTGHTKCYNDTEEIACPAAGADFYGQDAQYRNKCKAKSFEVKTVSGDKIVVDNNTKMEWQQAPSEKRYTWREAYIYCDTLKYAGKSDWRLPTTHEFLTIADLSKPGMDEHFSISENDVFWSATIKNYNPDSYPDTVYYSTFVWDNDMESNHRSAICVRGATLSPGNFISSEKEGDAILTESVSNLMWQEKNLDDIYVWQEALAYCENLTYAGFSDWRLPNRNELLTYTYTKDLSSLMSSSTAEWQDMYYNGSGDHSNKDFGRPAVCVRNAE